MIDRAFWRFRGVARGLHGSGKRVTRPGREQMGYPAYPSLAEGCGYAWETVTVTTFSDCLGPEAGWSRFVRGWAGLWTGRPLLGQLAHSMGDGRRGRESGRGSVYTCVCVCVCVIVNNTYPHFAGTANGAMRAASSEREREVWQLISLPGSCSAAPVDGLQGGRRAACSP
jgi:hypothetical protein